MYLLKKLGFYFIILIPVIIFYGIFYKYSVNIPINDDYAILDFLNKIISTDSVYEKIKLIFAQHNEHRIVYDRIWALISYKLSQQVNFNILALIGNLSLIPIFIIFAKKTQELNKNLIYLIPISVLIFNITFYENMTFAMATLSNLTVFVFSLLSIHFFTKIDLSNKNLTLAITFFVFATLTQGSGLFLIPIGLIILLYKKDRKKLLIFTVFSLIVVALYFYGYNKPPSSPSLLTTLLDFKIKTILFVFAFLGNAFDYNLIFTKELEDSVGITTILGFLFFLIYLNTIKTKYYKKNLFNFTVISLIILTGFITGVTRSQLGLDTAASSRYRINGIILIIGIYIWFIETNTIKQKYLIYVSIGLTSFCYLMFFSLRQEEYLSFRKKQSMTGVLHYFSGDHTKLNGFEQDLYKKILIESQSKQTYFLPNFETLDSFFPYSKIEKIVQTDANSEQFYPTIDAVAKIKEGYLIEGWGFVEEQNSDNQKVFIGIKNTSQTEPVFFTTNQVPRFDLNPFFKKNYIENAGFFARLKDNDVKPGENEIWVMIKVNDKVKLSKTDKKLIK